MEKCLFLTWLHAWPPYKRLRDEPRFPAMVQRLGLGGESFANPSSNDVLNVKYFPARTLSAIVLS